MAEARSPAPLTRLRAVLALTVAAALVVPAEEAAAARPRIAAYRGLGSWVDIYDSRQLSRPGRTLDAMKARGVRTLYLETSNYSRDRAIVHRGATERFIHGAHARGMRVVAWYLPGLRNLRRDRRRSLAAIRFRTSRGQRFDSFALDIEASIVRSQAERNRRLLSLSRFLRRRVGARYPLGAIIPSPRGMKLVRGYWESFPYRQLAGIYDVFLPMGYYTYRTNTQEAARDYTRRNFRIIRRETGKPGMPIHSVGGIAGASSIGEVRGFVRAVREHGGLGGSLYDFDGTTSGHWGPLAKIPVNPRQPVPLPAPLPYTGALGNVPGVDQSHPKEVSFLAGTRVGAGLLSFEAYDASAGEVEVFVNWTSIGTVPPTPPGAWGAAALPVPDDLLDDAGDNYILLVASGSYPTWSVWGVRGVSLDAV